MIYYRVEYRPVFLNEAWRPIKEFIKSDIGNVITPGLYERLTANQAEDRRFKLAYENPTLLFRVAKLDDEQTLE